MLSEVKVHSGYRKAGKAVSKKANQLTNHQQQTSSAAGKALRAAAVGAGHAGQVAEPALRHGEALRREGKAF